MKILKKMVVKPASDNVIWHIISKHNSRVRPYATFGIEPFFTRETSNLTQLNRFQTSGFRNKTVGIGQRRSRTKQRGTKYFKLIMKKKRKKS